jgi:predicted nucleic acid-binding protein
MKSLVVDASVVAKWVLPEVHSDAARDLLSVAEVLAPDLLWAELGNVLWRRWRQKDLDAQMARAMLSDLRSLEIVNFPVRPLLPPALDIAMSINHGVYDCVYLALAEETDGVMVTADRRFHDLVARSVWADRIVWIEDSP